MLGCPFLPHHSHRKDARVANCHALPSAHPHGTHTQLKCGPTGSPSPSPTRTRCSCGPQRVRDGVGSVLLASRFLLSACSDMDAQLSYGMLATDFSRRRTVHLLGSRGCCGGNGVLGMSCWPGTSGPSHTLYLTEQPRHAHGHLDWQPQRAVRCSRQTGWAPCVGPPLTARMTRVLVAQES